MLAMAALLPVEIIQTIFSNLSPETFDSARNVCKAWRFASYSSHVLREQLAQVPIKIPNVNDAVPQPSVADLHDAFRQAAFECLFGVRDKITRKFETMELPACGGAKTVWATSGNGQRMAAFHSGRLELYELTSGSLKLTQSRSLYPLWTSVSRAITDGMTSWLSMAPPYATYRLALSTNGDILAIALARTVQFYDLRPGFEDVDPIELVLNVPVQKPIAAAWTDVKGVIEAIEFTDKDRLLRIRVGREGVVKESSRVRYYGVPTVYPRFEPDREPTCAESPRLLFEYWKRAVNYVFADSIALSQTLREGDSLYLRGLQLLPWMTPSYCKDQGRLFTAMLQCQTQSNYCIGCINRLGEAIILAKLPNRSERLGGGWYKQSSAGAYMAWSDSIDTRYPAFGKLASAVPRWDPCNMPQVSASKPVLAPSDDGELMAVFEPGAGHSYNFFSGGSIYIYRLSGTLGQIGKPEVKHGPLPRVQPWPFLLDNVSEEVVSLKLKRTLGAGISKSYTLEAETSQRRIRWRMG